jgi:hypothetical protein
MAELADALASGASGGNPVEVQVLLPAPTFLTSGVTHNFAVVAERQTRQLEGLVRETSCGFKSRQPHQLIYGRRSDNKISYAGMAELADALASGASGGNPVEVQVLLPAPFKHQKHVAKATCFFSLYTKKEEPTTMHSHGPPPLKRADILVVVCLTLLVELITVIRLFVYAFIRQSTFICLKSETQHSATRLSALYKGGGPLRAAQWWWVQPLTTNH